MAPIPTQQQQAIQTRIRNLLLLLNLSQAKLAARLGMSPANLSKHLSGRLPITTGLVNRICMDLGISRIWLTTGEDIPFGKNDSLLPPEMYGREGSGRRGVPVYDIDVTAGFGPIEQLFCDERITGVINLPQLSNPENERIVRVSGDSMEPGIPSGCYIAIREVQSDTIFWGRPYVVILDDYRMVKILRRNSNPDLVTLHSENLQYDDLEVPRAEIRGIYLVDAVINLNIKP